ncbi:MAG TPA: ABC transporter permease [Prolixibacteraceae bacterium]|nr:ABC transporter permease [Prolixibacteraceae bacterium]
MFKKIHTGIQMTGQYFRDEFRDIRKDSGAILILIGALMIYPIIYSIAYKNEVVRELKTTVVDLDRTTTSRQLLKMLQGAEQIEINREANSLAEAKEYFFDGNSGGIVVIPQDFEKDILNGKQTNVSVFADGSYFLIYRQLIAGSVKTVSTFSAGIEIKKLMMEGKNQEQAIQMRDPLSADIHFWFNPSSGYGSFVMPGIIIIILQQTLLIGIGMLGGTNKEKKRDSFMVPRALRKGGVLPLLFGKSLSYLSIYAVNCVLTMVWLHAWFSYPNLGSYFSVLMLTLPFLLSVIFMGITLSVLFKRRESSIIFMVFMSPIVVFLSGISWPASSIPPIVYNLAHLFPSTIMIPAYLRIRNMGVGMYEIRSEYFLMLILMGFYFCTAALALYFSAMHHAKKAKKNETLHLEAETE